MQIRARDSLINRLRDGRPSSHPYSKSSTGTSTGMISNSSSMPPSTHPAVAYSQTPNPMRSNQHHTRELRTASSLPLANQLELDVTVPHFHPSQTHTRVDSLVVADSDVRDLTDGIDAGYPLTKTGRKKRGTDDDQIEDGNDGYAVDPPEDIKHPYKSKSYHIRRAFSLFGDLHAIMNDGIKRRAREAIGIFSSNDINCIQHPRDYETFNLITSHLDGLDQDILRLKRKPKVFRKLVRSIRQAADQGRNNDTANLKRDIACMLTEDGSCVLNAVRKGVRSSSKSDRGFQNDVMGKYLCPITLDWDNPRVRQDIRDGKHAIKASKVPRLLYANCECNVDDLEIGLGRNQALVRVVKYIFTGRSSAFSTTPGGKTTRAGNAALAGMKEITPRVVAYSACMLRFAISTEESWSKVDNEFNMEEFYWYVVDIFDDAQEFGRSLIAWWNMQVFGTSMETAGIDASSDDADFISLLKEQRAAKRAKILGNSTNVTAGSPHQITIDPIPQSPRNNQYGDPRSPSTPNWNDTELGADCSQSITAAAQSASTQVLSPYRLQVEPVQVSPSSIEEISVLGHSIRTPVPSASAIPSERHTASHYASSPAAAMHALIENSASHVDHRLIYPHLGLRDNTTERDREYDYRHTISEPQLRISSTTDPLSCRSTTSAVSPFTGLAASDLQASGSTAAHQRDANNPFASSNSLAITNKLPATNVPRNRELAIHPTTGIQSESVGYDSLLRAANLLNTSRLSMTGRP